MQYTRISLFLAFLAAGLAACSATTGVQKPSTPTSDGSQSVAFRLQPQLGPIHHIAFAPQGGFLAVAGTDGFLIYDTTTWQPQALLHANRPEGWLTPGLEGVTVAWSPDGQWLALGLTSEVRLWQTDPWREVARWDGIPVQDLVFDPSGEYLAVAQKGQNDIVVYARESGETIARLQGHTNAVLALDWAQTDVGPLLVSAGADGTVRLWDKPLQGRNPLVVLDHYVGQAWSVAFAPDHRLVASGAGAGVNRITVRSVVSRQVDLRLPGPTTPEAQVGVYALAFTPDSQQIFSAHAEGMVRVWRLEDCQAPPDAPPFATKTCSPYRAWQEKATTVAVSPNGAWLATAGEAGVVLIRPLPLP